MGDFIEVSAQGSSILGHFPNFSSAVSKILAGRGDLEGHIDWNYKVQNDKAFERCQYVLEAAGGKGWSWMSSFDHVDENADVGDRDMKSSRITSL
jgi:hypothetical protein